MPDISAVQAALAVDDTEHARELLRELLQSNPESAEIWYLAAQVAVNEKQREYFLEKATELEAQQPTTMPDSTPVDATPAFVVQAQPKQKQFQLAGLDRRLVAFAIDQMILSGIGALTLSVLSGFMPVEAINTDQAVADQWGNILLFIMTVEFVLYYVITLIRMQGQTIGKRVMKIRIIRRDGAPLTVWDAFLRCYIGYNLSVLSLGLGFLWAGIDKQQRAFHDILAKTIVVNS